MDTRPVPPTSDTDRLDNPSIAETKRFLELYTGIQSFYDEVNQNMDLVDCPFDFKFRPSSVRPIIDAKYLKYLQDNKIRPSESVVAYRRFIHEKISWRNRIRRECRPKDLRFAKWRDRQIARTKAEFGAERDDYFIHAPVMFELAEGCSVGCWFCAFSAPKLANVFDYSPNNAKLWRTVLQTVADVIGPGSRWSTNYFATDPLDNPDHEKFCEDFYEILGMWPQTTTAIPHKDVERTRSLLIRAREKGCRVNRFSIMNKKILHKVHESFTAEELRDVELIIQSQDSTQLKAKAGRYVDSAKKNKKIEAREDEKNVDALMQRFGKDEAEEIQSRAEDQPGSICCVTGFLVNLVEKTVKLISPVGADQRWPLGIIVFDQRSFEDGDDLRNVLEEMQADMVTELDMGDVVRFNRKLKVEFTELGFTLSSPATLIKLEGEAHQKFFRSVGELIVAGKKTANEICLLNFYKTMTPPQQTMGFLVELFERGLLEDELNCEPRSYFRNSGPQMIGERSENPKSVREMIG